MSNAFMMIQTPILYVLKMPWSLESERKKALH